MAYVPVPSLEWRRDRQRYTFLRGDAEGGRWRYEGLSTGFVAELTVDGDGLVIDYAGVFRRAWSAPLTASAPGAGG